MASIQTPDTVLYEVQEACKQMSLPVPSGVYDSLDDTAILMGSVANLAGIMIADAFPWEFLQEIWTLTGDNVRTEWDLPPDLGRIVDNTGWTNSTRAPVQVLNAQQWAMVTSWVGSSFTINPVARIYKNQVQFQDPIPLGSTVTFQYTKRTWVNDADNPSTTKQRADKNGDQPMFDWLLMVIAIKVKFREHKLLDTTSVMMDFQDRLFQLTNKDQLSPTLNLSGPAVGDFRFLDMYNAPDSGYGR